jgi:phosphatidylglycerophosphatase GEP4
MKPGYACISSIRAYFASLPRPVRDDELLVVGDRVFTDVVLANRMKSKHAVKSSDGDYKKSGFTEPSWTRNGPLSVLTTGVWQRESMLMRAAEAALVQAVRRWVVNIHETRLLREAESKFTRTPVVAEHSLQRRPGWLVKMLRGVRA